MKIIRTLTGEKPLGGSILTLGVYDGVHLGHKKIISEVAAESGRTGLPSAAVTFNPHPSHVLPGNPAGLITDEEQKLKILEECGLDICVILRFTEEFSRKSAEDFISEIIAGFMGAKSVIVGFNHVFGAGRKGSARLLSEAGAKYDFSVKLVKPVRIKGETISSSKIRELVRGGDIQKANLFLGRRFFLSGIVKKGKGIGTKIGFPTANIEIPPGMLEPAPGVYAGECSLGGNHYPAVLYSGHKPTFGGMLEKTSMEVHIMGFSGNIYGKRAGFGFMRRLRAETKFETAEALREKIAEDIEEARRLVKI
jgi:riboflavin kinase / FMN adenylyltransferase